jgi:hypothetical protein
MPRATRSKKIVIAEDDTDIASQIPLPDTPRKERPALVEISLNPEEETMTVEDAEMAAQLKGLKAAYKEAIGVKKNKKGKGKKTAKKPIELVVTGGAPDVVEDEQPAAVSLAAEGARRLLSSDEGSLMFLLRAMAGRDLTVPEDLPSTEEEKSKTPPSPAVRATRQKLAKTKSGQFNSVVSLPAGYTSGLLGKHGDFASAIDSSSYGRPIQNWMAVHYASSEGCTADNFYQVAEPNGNTEIRMSPRKEGITTLEAVEKACEAEKSVNQISDGAAEDSFVEQITTRSPAKPVSRIEDSVEALDKMEEAIEALGQAALAVSPTETASKAPAQKKMAKAAAKPFSSLRVKPQDARPNVKTMAGADVKAKEGVRKAKSSSALRDAAEVSEEKAVVAKKPVKRPASLLPPKEPVKSAKPPTKPAFELPGEAVARKLKEQREARKAQRESSDEGSTTAKAPAPATKVKSAKPPTKPTFELPGEAISRKKREAHEARLKVQEEEERKRREFKAKPPRNSVQPDFIPRENAASLARKNQVVRPESDNAAPGQQRNSISVSKRGSIVGAHRPSIMAANLANISAPRAPGPASPSQAPHARKASTTSGPSMSGLAMQRTVSASEVQLQRQRAKEIYMRDVKALEEMEKEKREREAAAKKSRLEAAERGRQASREWAEKQRAKKAAEGDKGLSAGYGPGGQLGLKA